MARPQVDRPGRHHRGARVLRLALRHWKALLQQAVGRRPLVRRLSAQKPRLLLQKRECAAEEEGLKSASGFPTRGPERLVQSVACTGPVFPGNPLPYLENHTESY